MRNRSHNAYAASVDPERRQLGLTAAIAIVIGESIALGIFLTPAAMARSLGSPLLLGLVWSAMAFMAFCGALCYSELAVRFPESGGEYVYLRHSFGEAPAFLYGWMSTMVMYPGVAAALAVGAAAYVATLVPMGKLAAACVPAALLLAFMGMNLLGNRMSGRWMTALNLLKLGILFALVCRAVFSSHAHLANLLPLAARRPASEALFPAIAGAMISAFFSFGGWWEAGKVAGEVRNPERNLPIAFLGGVGVVTAIYLLISFAFLIVMPAAGNTPNVAFVAQFGQALFGGAGAKILSICVLVCVCGGLAALTMAAPRVCFAMARAGALFPSFARLSKSRGVPANAILLQTALALAALLLGAFDRILAYIIFSAVLFQGLTACSLFRLREPVRRWWYPAAPILFILCCAIIALLILLHDPLPAFLGMAIVLCGEPLRRLMPRRNLPQELVIERS
jgi:basic amino acid/polyamine antiporter, APA family